MSESPVNAPVPMRFVVVAFVVAVVIGIAVAYFGIHGQLGGGIP